MSVTFRTDVRNNYVTTLEAFMAANPTLVNRVYRARPPSLAENRWVFVGGITEAIPDMHSGVWQREVNVDILVGQLLGDNVEATDNLEVAADALVEWLSADARAHVCGLGSEQQPIRSASVEIDEGGVFIPAVAITCRARVQQGRD